MELIIDHREKDIKEYFISKQVENVSYQNLDIGDIIFKKNNEIVVLIERKSLFDFADSFKNGRYREQKIRILNSNLPKSKIIYLIEGRMEKIVGTKINGLPKTTLISTLISLMIKDNIKIYQTADIKETCFFIHKILYKMKKNPELLNKTQTDPTMDYLSTIKLKKKENLTPEICYLAQLSQIPGISNNIAKTIYNIFPNMIELCKAMEKDNQCLLNLEYNIANNKKRKIGTKTNQKIVSFLLNKC